MLTGVAYWPWNFNHHRNNLAPYWPYHLHHNCWEVLPQRIYHTYITVSFYNISIGLSTKLNFTFFGFHFISVLVITIERIYILLIMNWALTKHFPGIYVCHFHKTTMGLSPLEIRRELKHSEVKKLAPGHSPSRAWSVDLKQGSMASHSQFLTTAS